MKKPLTKSRKGRTSRKRGGGAGVDETPASTFAGPDMTRWSVAQRYSALYSQLLLISLSLGRLADIFAARSESRAPPITAQVVSTDDKEETFPTPRNSAQETFHDWLARQDEADEAQGLTPLDRQ